MPHGGQAHDARDPVAHLFGVAGHAEDYQRLAGKPTRPLSDRAFSLLAYRIEPDKAAYFDLKDLERRWNKQHGRPEGRSTGGRSSALYDFKIAIRYEDRQAASNALVRYFEFGGTPDGIRQALDRMAPLSAIPTSERRAFLRFLLRSPSLQRKVLDRLQIMRPGPEEFIERLAASPELQRRVLQRVQEELAAIDAMAPSCLGEKLRRMRVSAAAVLSRSLAVGRESVRRRSVRLRARTMALVSVAARPRAVAPHTRIPCSSRLCC